MTAKAKLVAPSPFEDAVVLHRRGQLRKAERLYRKHLKLDGQHSGALQGLGIILSQLDRHLDAVIVLRRALSCKPDSFEAHSNLGMALLSVNRRDEAADHFERALALNPQHAEAHNGAGMVHVVAGRYEAALSCYRSAIASRPDFAEAFSNLGLALRLLGHLEPARAAYQRAIALSPGNPEDQLNLGILQAQLGDLAAAEAAYEKGLELAPLRTDIHRHLAAIKRYRNSDPQLAQMLALARRPRSLSPLSRMELHFALGKALIDIGAYQQAFAHLCKGNALRRRQTTYDEAATLAMFARIRAAFNGSPKAVARESGDLSPTLVFVIGMPRSGTTLVEQILASHPEVLGASELPYLGEAAGALEPFPEAVAAMTSDALREFGASYAARVRALAPTAACIIDKMPLNFQYIGLIRQALPNARIIHVRRDPIDTCMSCFTQLFIGPLPYSYDLGELGRYYRAYEALMAHWRRVLPSGVMLEVDYERLVEDLPGETRRMVAYCGLDWADACLEFHMTQRPVQTASLAQVRQPIYRTSVRHWHRHLALLGPLLDALGVVDGDSRIRADQGT